MLGFHPMELSNCATEAVVKLYNEKENVGAREDLGASHVLRFKTAELEPSSQHPSGPVSGA